MEAVIYLPLKAFSVNAYHFRDKRHKTPEARAWEASVQEALTEHKVLVDMADKWRVSGGVFHVYLDFIYPPHIFFNKDGTISSKTFDLSNVEKPVIDQVFGATMDINDKLITRLVSTKIVGPTFGIVIRLELKTESDS